MVLYITIIAKYRFMFPIFVKEGTIQSARHRLNHVNDPTRRGDRNGVLL